ncbi:hypothetical protein GO986_16465 [Deinococcus sp. HMF7620]|uniref:Uncharacterized protein n=1 Tax=Deinococcus arboris TaxID=2682977 RepID=A0A7C9LWE7_9DEIO|nr:hypothetical protein [Deinococcus arboris]MVN88340.1 hypothetical protein [Deinococcus arboris]
MSRLLINETPLQVLPSLAEKIGLNEAIFLQQLHFLSLNCRLIGGRRWYSIKVEEWCRTFKFWSKRTVERIITSLRNQALIETTDEFNRDADDRTLFYAVNYAALEELEFQAEKPAPSAVRQSGGVHPDDENQGGYQENTVPAESAKLAEGVAEPRDVRAEGSANLADSSLLKIKPTTPTPEAIEARAALAGGGVAGVFQEWIDHLGFGPGPALNLTLSQWAAWTDEGLGAELKEAGVSVMLMGNRATDPSALLRARMERQRTQKAADVARRAERQRLLNVGADQISEGAQFVTPAGQVATVDYVDSGYVFWREANLAEAAIGLVCSWERRGGAA